MVSRSETERTVRCSLRTNSCGCRRYTPQLSLLLDNSCSLRTNYYCIVLFSRTYNNGNSTHSRRYRLQVIYEKEVKKQNKNKPYVNLYYKRVRCSRKRYNNIFFWLHACVQTKYSTFIKHLNTLFCRVR
jgi:hypothetical protein